MMPRRHGPLYLERAAYRRRRLADATRLLPLATLAVLLVPVWLVPAAMSGAGGMIWLFGLWFAVIIASALLHRRLARGRSPEDSSDEL